MTLLIREDDDAAAADEGAVCECSKYVKQNCRISARISFVIASHFCKIANRNAFEAWNLVSFDCEFSKISRHTRNASGDLRNDNRICSDCSLADWSREERFWLANSICSRVIVVVMTDFMVMAFFFSSKFFCLFVAILSLSFSFSFFSFVLFSFFLSFFLL